MAIVFENANIGDRVYVVSRGQIGVVVDKNTSDRTLKVKYEDATAATQLQGGDYFPANDLARPTPTHTSICDNSRIGEQCKQQTGSKPGN